MKRISIIIVLVLAFSASYFPVGCGKVTPKREHIPLIKKSLVRLQTGVKEQNLAAIDSVLSPRILEKKQSSDSLVRFVFGDDYSFVFEQFGGAEIAYVQEEGRIDCFVMDSTHTRERPIVFYIAFEHDMWLVTSFEEGAIESDSL